MNKGVARRSAQALRQSLTSGTCATGSASASKPTIASDGKAEPVPSRESGPTDHTCKRGGGIGGDVRGELVDASTVRIQPVIGSGGCETVGTGWQIADPKIAICFGSPRQSLASLSKTTRARGSAVLFSNDCDSHLFWFSSSSMRDSPVLAISGRSCARASTSSLSARGITSFTSAQVRRAPAVVQQQVDQHCEAEQQPHPPPSHRYACDEFGFASDNTTIPSDDNSMPTIVRQTATRCRVSRLTNFFQENMTGPTVFQSIRAVKWVRRLDDLLA